MSAAHSVTKCPDCAHDIYECICRASDDETDTITSITSSTPTIIPTFNHPPLEKLKVKAKELIQNEDHVYQQEFADAMDRADPLSSYRSLFHIPRCPTTSYVDDKSAAALSLPATPQSSNDVIYLCGNSLGLMPRATPNLIQQELNKWATIGVEGHFRGEYPWARIDEEATRLTQSIVGATHVNEIAICNSLSVNLHLCMVSFYRPTNERYKIMMESAAFCSDHHVVRSQLALHGYTHDTTDALIQLESSHGKTYITTEDILAAIEKYGDQVALIMLPGVQFYTGQLFDMAAITAAGHAKGCMVGFDLAHAVGNVPLALHDWNIDFACWCTYKYLNAGPGAIAGLFIHQQHHKKTQQELPRFQGWWGQHANVRFQMKPEHEHVENDLGAQGWLLSNPAVLPTLCLTTSLQLFTRAGMNNLREKSFLLTGYLESLLYHEIIQHQSHDKTITILTPNDPSQRGCQLSLLLSLPVRPINVQLEHAGIICDVREPNVLRVAPTPLYNTFNDVFQFVRTFKRVWNEAK